MLSPDQIIEGGVYRNKHTKQLCVVVQVASDVIQLDYLSGLLWWTAKSNLHLEELTPLEKELL